jgi:hypothetical protein
MALNHEFFKGPQNDTLKLKPRNSPFPTSFQGHLGTTASILLNANTESIRPPSNQTPG